MSLSKNTILANRSREDKSSKNGFFECFFKVGHKVFSRLALPERGSRESIYEATTFFTSFSKPFLEASAHRKTLLKNLKKQVLPGSLNVTDLVHIAFFFHILVGWLPEVVLPNHDQN